MPNLPEKIGPYPVLRLLGQGGMGAVYLAKDPQLEREVAIKLMHLPPGLSPEAEAELRMRFQREARAAGSLGHPNIVLVHHYGVHDDRDYIVMEYVKGKPLSKYVPTADMGFMLRGLLQVAEALDYAHGQGVVHRDIKPANIMVREDFTFKVTDFGVARLMNATEITSSGATIGTPNYIAPETLRGQKASPASDQYALGIVAYEILAKRMPFEAPTTEALYYQILHQPPPEVHRLNPELRPSVDAVLRKVLDKDPQRRFGNCAEFVHHLRHAFNGGALDLPGAGTDRVRIGALALIALILVGSGLTFYYHGIQRPRLTAFTPTASPAIAEIQLNNDLSPPPYVEQPPPALEGTANPQYADTPLLAKGPRNAKARLQFWNPNGNELRLALRGGDGTMYVGSAAGKLWAVREGKVQWGFEDVAEEKLIADADGRIWVEEAILNPAGAGGRIRKSRPEPRHPVRRAEEIYRWAAPSPCGDKFQVLDECENSAEADGVTYLITSTRKAFAFDAKYKRLWEVALPCRTPDLADAAAGTLVLGCRGSRDFAADHLVGIRDGKVAWTFRAAAEIEFGTKATQGKFLLDATGTSYFVDAGTTATLYAVDRDGKLLWKSPLPEVQVNHLQLDPRGRLFVSAMQMRNTVHGSVLACFADSDC